MRTDLVTLPAFLATAFVNGDFTSFDDAGEDQKLFDKCIAYCAPGRIVSTEQDTYNEFATIYIAGQRFSGAVVDYIVHYED